MAIRAPNHSLQTAAAKRAPGAGASSRAGSSALREVPLRPRCLATSLPAQRESPVLWVPVDPSTGTMSHVFQ